MSSTGTAELPRARRAWMGPPPAALGSLSPRNVRGPIPNRCVDPSRTVADLGRRGPAGQGPGSAYIVAARALSGRRSTTSRDGVAHEAPLSKVWRDLKSAL